jgi:hypothetical protein
LSFAWRQKQSSRREWDDRHRCECYRHCRDYCGWAVCFQREQTHRELVRRFIDPRAVFFYVPAAAVRIEAASLGAEPYDISDVTFSHRGPRCSFDAFLDEFELHDPILDQLADIVRAADTATLERSQEAPGLLAISLGMSAIVRDDILLLEQAMSLYDALYAWCKTARDETHSWPQTKGVQA